MEFILKKVSKRQDAERGSKYKDVVMLQVVVSQDQEKKLCVNWNDERILTRAHAEQIDINVCHEVGKMLSPFRIV